MSGWPLVLRHADITRIVNRNATRLIVTRSIKPGVYELHDQHVVRRNERYKKQGRWDLQYDPAVVSINVEAVVAQALKHLDLSDVRGAGYKTQREFYDYWYETHRRYIDPWTLVRVARFHLVEPVRMLHRNVARGYTTNPREAVRDEPSALSESELKRYADTARWRDDQERREAAHLARLRKREGSVMTDDMITFQVRFDLARKILDELPPRGLLQASPLGVLRYEIEAACREVEHREEVRRGFLGRRRVIPSACNRMIANELPWPRILRAAVLEAAGAAIPG